jgi:hypothetical protein
MVDDRGPRKKRLGSRRPTVGGKLTMTVFRSALANAIWWAQGRAPGSRWCSREHVMIDATQRCPRRRRDTASREGDPPDALARHEHWRLTRTNGSRLEKARLHPLRHGAGERVESAQAQIAAAQQATDQARAEAQTLPRPRTRCDRPMAAWRAGGRRARAWRAWRGG